MSMGKIDFIREMSKKSDISQAKLDDFLAVFVETVKDIVSRGESIRVTGLGAFEPVVRKSRKAFNPKTGEEVIVPEKTAIKFKPSKEFKERVNLGTEM